MATEATTIRQAEALLLKLVAYVGMWNVPGASLFSPFKPWTQRSSTLYVSSPVVPHTIGSSSRQVHLLCTLDHAGFLVLWCQPLIGGRGHVTFCKCQSTEVPRIFIVSSVSPDCTLQRKPDSGKGCYFASNNYYLG